MDAASLLSWLMTGVTYGLPLVLGLGLPVWLIARDVLQSRQGAEVLRPLQATAEWLTACVLVTAIGLPALELFGEADWQAGFLLAGLVLTVRAVVLSCCYAALGAMLVFFHRALSNINYLAGKPLCSPRFVFLVLLPGVNLILMPLVWYDAHYYSRRLDLGTRVSWHVSAVLAISTVLLFLISVLLALITGLRPEVGLDLQNGFSHSVISFCAATAGTLLFTRMVLDIRVAQHAIAAKWNGQGLAKPRSQGHAFLERLRWGAVALLIAVGVGTAIVASLPSDPIGTARDDARSPPPRSPADEAILQTVANNINKAGRTQLDQITWLEAARVERGIFVYEYSVTLNKLSNPEILQFLQRVRPNMIRGYCTDPSFKVFRELQTTVVFRYMFADRAPLGQINLSLNDCPK